MAKPSIDDQIEQAFEPYFLALGKVAHEWNHMQEELGKLFCTVVGLGESMGMTLWHSLRSDLAQRQMLVAAAGYMDDDEDWRAKFPKAAEAIADLVEDINRFSNKRNAAIHAPCSVILDEGELEIIAVSFSRNPNAQKLRGKDILAEFDWYERKADAYRRHVRDLAFALSDARVPWPDKPVWPHLGAKSTP